MNEEIKKVQDYFTAKILAGEFKVKSYTVHTMVIIVDELYSFTIWTANQPVDRKPYHNVITQPFMILEFTNEQAVRCFAVTEPLITEYKNTVLLTEKRAQYEKLRIELGV